LPSHRKSSFEGDEQNFDAFYHKENPIFAILPERINPTHLSDAVDKSKTIGVRGGQSIVDYLQHEQNRKNLFAHLEERAERNPKLACNRMASSPMRIDSRTPLMKKV
jgi:hypothetical protein